MEHLYLMFGTPKTTCEIQILNDRMFIIIFDHLKMLILRQNDLRQMSLIPTFVFERAYL